MIGTVIDSTGREQALWSGELRIIGDLTPATPQVSRCGLVSVVWACGLLTREAALDIALLATKEARMGQAQTVIVALASAAGEISGLAAACNSMVELCRNMRLVTYTQLAFGASLWMAARLGRVYAPPTAQLGIVRAGLVTGDYDFPGTTQLLLSLHEQRRWVDQNTWDRLTDNWVNGEQAEAIGICELVPSVDVLVARYNGEVQR